LDRGFYEVRSDVLRADTDGKSPKVCIAMKRSLGSGIVDLGELGFGKLRMDYGWRFRGLQEARSLPTIATS
jgi:hypothetical protein